MRKTRLWLEFLGFFLVAPVLVAVFLPATAIFPVLFAFTAIGLVLLVATPDFSWRELVRNTDLIEWAVVGSWIGATLGTCYAVARINDIDVLSLPREQPELMLMIALLYPLLSALPQELVYRVLFFRRYAPILPAAQGPRLFLNATLFSLAHLLYWSPLVAAMTFTAGLVFAWSYDSRENFPEALLMHAVSGIIVFSCRSYSAASTEAPVGSPT